MWQPALLRLAAAESTRQTEWTPSPSADTRLSGHSLWPCSFLAKLMHPDPQTRPSSKVSPASGPARPSRDSPGAPPPQARRQSQASARSRALRAQQSTPLPLPAETAQPLAAGLVTAGRLYIYILLLNLFHPGQAAEELPLLSPLTALQTFQQHTCLLSSCLRVWAK
jgi:hypothetical protein